MGTDTKFKITHPKNGYGDQAYWRWSILPLVEKKYWKNTKAVFNKVQYEWRGRLYALRKAGYPPLQKKTYAYTRNCPPAGVWVDQSSRQCKLDRICPFCWGRTYVFECWNRLIPTLFPVGSTKGYADRHLIRAAKTCRFASIEEAMRVVQ